MFKIVNKEGYLVETFERLIEACQFRSELYEQDRRDGTFEPGYFRIVKK